MEMAALITAARWVAGGEQQEAPAEAVNQIRQVLESYEKQISQERFAHRPAGPDRVARQE
jgi:hypothetical protein